MACRKNNWPLDHSVIYTTVSKFFKPDDVEERPDEANPNDIYFSILKLQQYCIILFHPCFKQGCYVYGLYLEGARWDIEEHRLQRSHPKVLFEALPILTIIPIEVHRLKLQVLNLPIYIVTQKEKQQVSGGRLFPCRLYY